jgi:uncharacterized RDD family membrane protein YckC
MTQGYGPPDPNQPGYGQQQPPPPPSGYGQQPPGTYGQQPAGYAQPSAYGGERAGYFMGRQLANWLQRAGSYLIDGLIAGIPILLAGLLSGALTDGYGNTNAGVGLIVFVLYLASFGIVVYNRWILQGRTGQSWGKQVLRLRLVKMADGQPVGPLMAFARDLCHLLDSLACYIGWLFPLWDSRRQTFADKLINTVVLAEA